MGVRAAILLEYYASMILTCTRGGSPLTGRTQRAKDMGSHSNLDPSPKQKLTLPMKSPQKSPITMHAKLPQESVPLRSYPDTLASSSQAQIPAAAQMKRRDEPKMPCSMHRVEVRGEQRSGRGQGDGEGQGEGEGKGEGEGEGRSQGRARAGPGPASGSRLGSAPSRGPT